MAAPVDVLQRVPLFAELNQRQLKRLAADFRERRFKEGTAIVRQDEMSGVGFFVITDGVAAVEIDDREVATLGTGDHFGELALISEGLRTATVKAITPLDLSRDHLLGFPARRQGEPGHHLEAVAVRRRAARRRAARPVTRFRAGAVARLTRFRGGGASSASASSSLRAGVRSRAADGFVGRRVRGTAVASRSCARIRSVASSRFRSCDRSSWAIARTTGPSSRRTRSRSAGVNPLEPSTSKRASTRVELFCACWPPGPLEREKRNATSERIDSLSMAAILLDVDGVLHVSGNRSREPRSPSSASATPATVFAS